MEVGETLELSFSGEIFEDDFSTGNQGPPPPPPPTGLCDLSKGHSLFPSSRTDRRTVVFVPHRMMSV